MGGTFDPIHHGHLVAASEVQAWFDLDEVVFVPTGAPWQKSDEDVSPLLLPRLTGGDEDDLVEAEQTLHFRGGDEVAVVDGVEGAAHHPDPGTPSGVRHEVAVGLSCGPGRRRRPPARPAGGAG